MTATAFVRPVPDSFEHCVTAMPVDPPLDPQLARTQHAAYRRSLAEGGFDVVEVPGAPGNPDSAFIEDVAVVIGGRALATRPGHPSRRDEVAAVAAVLACHVGLTTMAPPATLDGGDVLVVGDRVFVGRSGRTNAAGIAALAEFCAPLAVVPVPVHGVLHLKSGASAIDADTVLLHPNAVDPAGLPGVRIVEALGDDPGAANVLRLPNGSVLVAAHHEGTRRIVEALGSDAVTVDISEFARADGAVTCLSIVMGDQR